MNSFVAIDTRQLRVQVRVSDRLIHESFIPILEFLYIHQTFLDVLLHFVVGLMVIELIIPLVLALYFRIKFNR